MRNFGTLLTLILGLGIGTVLAVPASPGADQGKINELIAKLGSNNFRERDAANKELNAIGEPALEALRKAAKSNDMEIANRAAALISKIEQRAENARLLAPTYVELKLKEATIDDAVAELSKKSGFAIVIAGDKTKMADRRVTLETGRVPFWKALDMLCQKAGLVEADPGTSLPAVDLPPQPVPPIRIQPVPAPLPVKPINIKPVQIRPINVKPLPADKPPVEDKPAAKPAVPQGFSADQPAPPKEVPPQRAQAQPAQAQPAPPVILPAQPAVQPLPPIGGRRPPTPIYNNGQMIVLVDGKSTGAADVGGAIRVRAIQNPNLLANYGPIPEGEIGMLLEVKAEPKIQVQQILGVKIDKAIDNHDQALTPAMVSGLIGPQTDEQRAMQMKIVQLQAQGQVQIQIGGIAKPGYAGPGMYYGNSMVPTRLKKGAKDPKSLKELRGTVTLKMRTGIEDLVAVENILKAKGESVRGKGESTLKVVDVAKADNGEITVQVELQFSTEVQPQVQQPGGVPQLPPPPAAPLPVPPQGGIRGGLPRTPAVYNYLGLDLVDAKGGALQLVKLQVTQNQWMNNARAVSATLTFKPQKDQEGAKLVFRGSRAATVDVAFLLKDVPLK